MSDFDNQVVILTGAAGNLGRALAQSFRAAGARCVLVDHRPGRLEALYPELGQDAAHYLAAPVDLARLEEVQAMVAETQRRFGQIDVLVNAAGGYAGGVPLAEVGLDEWQGVVRRNVETALVTTKAVLPHMLERKRGCIVFVSSRTAYQSGAKSAAYAAAKAMLLKLTESLSAEVKNEGIRVNCVVPSTLDTPENRAALSKADPAKWVTPESLAQVILFLCSPAARDIHGAALPVYGRV